MAAEAATRQKLEQAVADEQRFRAQLASREAERGTAPLRSSHDAGSRVARQLAVPNRDSSAKRQRAVLDSHNSCLARYLLASRLLSPLARTNLNYTRITAPVDGIVGDWSAARTIGQPGHADPLAGARRCLGASQLKETQSVLRRSGRDLTSTLSRGNYSGQSSTVSGQRIAICAVAS